MPSQSLLIVDDHPVYRDALHQYLSRRFSPLGVESYVASTISEGIKLAQSRRTSWVVLLDLSIPDSQDHLSGIRQFHELELVDSIVAISGLEEHLWKDRCLEAGCEAFISKNSEVDYIYNQICALMPGCVGQGASSRLTARQLEILKCIVQGQSNKVIAFNLNIKEQTVKIHINAIFKELKVTNRTQAAYRANQLNLF
jgi:DNA-binding NarL/FixJ family response regulator